MPPDDPVDPMGPPPPLPDIAPLAPLPPVPDLDVPPPLPSPPDLPPPPSVPPAPDLPPPPPALPEVPESTILPPRPMGRSWGYGPGNAQGSPRQLRWETQRPWRARPSTSPNGIKTVVVLVVVIVGWRLLVGVAGTAFRSNPSGLRPVATTAPPRPTTVTGAGLGIDPGVVQASDASTRPAAVPTPEAWPMAHVTIAATNQSIEGDVLAFGTDTSNIPTLVRLTTVDGGLVPRWTTGPISGFVRSIAVGSDTVYLVGNQVQAFSLHDGQFRWSVAATDIQEGCPNCVVVRADRLYVRHIDSVAAYDSATGQVEWHRPRNGRGGVWALGGQLLVTDYDLGQQRYVVDVLDPATGAVRADVPLTCKGTVPDSRVPAPPQLALVPGTDDVLAVWQQAVVCATRFRTSGAEVWSSSTDLLGASQEAPPLVVSGGQAYVGRGPSIAVDLRTGAVAVVARATGEIEVVAASSTRLVAEQRGEGVDGLGTLEATVFDRSTGRVVRTTPVDVDGTIVRAGPVSFAGDQTPLEGFLVGRAAGPFVLIVDQARGRVLTRRLDLSTGALGPFVQVGSFVRGEDDSGTGLMVDPPLHQPDGSIVLHSSLGGLVVVAPSGNAAVGYPS
jgi:hypothetical protein